MVLTLVVLIFLSVHSFGTITSCLRTLSKGAKQISAGNLEDTVAVKGPTEFTDLATSFNEMQIAIKNRDAEIRSGTKEIEELNIGHAIIAQAVFSGLPEAIREMKRLMIEARQQAYLT